MTNQLKVCLFQPKTSSNEAWLFDSSIQNVKSFGLRNVTSNKCKKSRDEDGFTFSHTGRLIILTKWQTTNIASIRTKGTKVVFCVLIHFQQNTFKNTNFSLFEFYFNRRTSNRLYSIWGIWKKQLKFQNDESRICLFFISKISSVRLVTSYFSPLKIY